MRAARHRRPRNATPVRGIRIAMRGFAGHRRGPDLRKPAGFDGIPRRVRGMLRPCCAASASPCEDSPGHRREPIDGSGPVSMGIPRRGGVPNGIRTRVSALKGLDPRPLDDGDVRRRRPDVSIHGAAGPHSRDGCAPAPVRRRPARFSRAGCRAAHPLRERGRVRDGCAGGGRPSPDRRGPPPAQGDAGGGGAVTTSAAAARRSGRSRPNRPSCSGSWC